MYRWFVGICACLGLVSSSASAEEWPGWRGPRGDGTVSGKLPVTWGADENVVWKTPIPGKGHSSPVIWKDRIFLTTCLEKPEEKPAGSKVDPNPKDRLLLCLDRKSGKILWERVVQKSPLEPKHSLNSYASSTPATDGTHVWVTFQDASDAKKPLTRVYCYDFDGKLAWEKTPGEFHSRHGFCSPPILYKNLVIVNGDQDAVAWIVGLDKTTGKESWRADRPNRTRSYCPPLLIDSKQGKQLVLSGSKSVASYDPDTGKQIWLIKGPTEQFVASLVYQHNVLFLTTGFPEYHLMGISPDGQGDVTKSAVVWHHANIGSANASYVPSPIAHGDLFFVVSDTGFAQCLDVKTGEKIWKQRLGQHHSASPIVAGGLLYFPDDYGITWVLKPDRNFEVVAKNNLKEEIFASPAAHEGHLFLRGANHFYCIGKK
jgi:outer membrane protein assembly factor BamB